MDEITVRDLMQHHYVSLTPDMPVSVAAKLLTDAHQIGAPVLDANRKLIGWVSQQDFIKVLVDATYYCSERSQVEEVMKTEVLHVSASTSVIDLAQLMTLHKPKMYPVCDDGQLVGMITRSEVVNSLLNSLQHCRPVA